MGKETTEPVGTTGDFNYSGYFDWPGLYTLLASWANKEMYKIYEPLYKDKVNKAGFTERELNWWLEKKVDRMHKYFIEVEIKMWDVQQVEITENKETKKLDRGRFRIRISSKIDKDFQNLYSDKKNKNLWKIYSKVTNWDYNFNHWDFLYNKMFEFLNEIKNYVGVDSKV